VCFLKKDFLGFEKNTKMITEPEMIKSALCDLERKMDAQLNQRLSELLDNQSKVVIFSFLSKKKF